jgi:N-acetylglucosamine-6-phosphate deacetylase
MTIAPELSGSQELYAACWSRGVTPCFGHSAADTGTALAVARNYFEGGGQVVYSQVDPGGPSMCSAGCGQADPGDPSNHPAGRGQAVYSQVDPPPDSPRDSKRGRKLGITHLFNGMSPISHKRSGLAALPFLYGEPFVELNGDGVHVNDETLLLCYTYLDHERLMLISDAVVSAGIPEEQRRQREFTYFGKPVQSGDQGVRYQDSGTLIGSNSLIADVLRHVFQTVKAPLYTVVRCATLNPCRFLGIDDMYGSLTPGKKADIVLFDRELVVTSVLKSE